MLKKISLETQRLLQLKLIGFNNNLIRYQAENQNLVYQKVELVSCADADDLVISTDNVVFLYPYNNNEEYLKKVLLQLAEKETGYVQEELKARLGLHYLGDGYYSIDHSYLFLKVDADVVTVIKDSKTLYRVRLVNSLQANIDNLLPIIKNN